MHHSNTWHHDLFPQTFNCMSFKKINMQKFKFVICVPQQMEPQPRALAQTLNVVLETCREQRKLIGMLTQKNNQERIVKLSEACHCCKGYDQPCLPNKVILSAVCYCCVGYDRPCLQSPLQFGHQCIIKVSEKIPSR